jgi:hypothetical protein
MSMLFVAITTYLLVAGVGQQLPIHSDHSVTWCLVRTLRLPFPFHWYIPS